MGELDTKSTDGPFREGFHHMTAQAQRSRQEDTMADNDSGGCLPPQEQGGGGGGTVVQHAQHSLWQESHQGGTDNAWHNKEGKEEDKWGIPYCAMPAHCTHKGGVIRVTTSRSTPVPCGGSGTRREKLNVHTTLQGGGRTRAGNSGGGRGWICWGRMVVSQRWWWWMAVDRGNSTAESSGRGAGGWWMAAEGGGGIKSFF